MKAIDAFYALEEGIEHSIRAAEIYVLHIGSINGARELDQSVIRDIIAGKAMSGIRVLSNQYKDVEKKSLVEKGYLVSIGSQILLATYTALEFYLIEKFKEYARFRSKGDNAFTDKVLDHLGFRSLEQIRNMYRDILDIHLHQFEFEMAVDEDSSFRTKTSWAGLQMIAKARNEIAHEGKPKSYQIRLLPDVWDAFDFVSRWVKLFDTNFDTLIYKGRSTKLIREHKRRVAHQEGVTTG